MLFTYTIYLLLLELNSCVCVHVTRILLNSKFLYIHVVHRYLYCKFISNALLLNIPISLIYIMSLVHNLLSWAQSTSSSGTSSQHCRSSKISMPSVGSGGRSRRSVYLCSVYVVFYCRFVYVWHSVLPWHYTYVIPHCS